VGGGGGHKFGFGNQIDGVRCTTKHSVPICFLFVKNKCSESIESSFSVTCQTLVAQLFYLLCFAFVVSGVYSVPFLLERVNEFMG
jgi:hypothetical protein